MAGAEAVRMDSRGSRSFFNLQMISVLIVPGPATRIVSRTIEFSNKAESQTTCAEWP
jgi:hypothetical protein